MRIEELKRIVNNISLETMEMQGGHTLFQHFNLTDSQLMTRCKKDKKAASVFDINKEELISFMKQTLLNEEYEVPACVCEWLNDDSDGEDYNVYLDFPEKIGHMFSPYKWHNWNDGAIECHELIVVLRKVQRATDSSFIILTSYPHATDDDIKKQRQ